MKKGNFKRLVAMLCAMTLLGGSLGAVSASAAPADWANYKGVRSVTNKNGLVLKYHVDSGVGILYDTESGYYFKDLNKNGRIDVYEDWRKDIDTRTNDLLSQMPLSQKLALMAHNGSVSGGFRMAVSRSIGKGAQADGSSGNLNQKNAETTQFGIPYSYSSDPVHTGFQDTGANDPESGGGVPVAGVTGISCWPNTLGLANTFSTDVHYKFGRTIAKEYRNSQMFQQLGPLFDQLTHPTWSRSGAAVTEDYDLLIDLAQAEVAGMQTTEGAPIADYGLPAGWGKESISAMAKHVLGTASGEFGYEGHTNLGEFLVYPGGGYQKYIETITKAAGIGVYPQHSPKVVNAAMTAYGIDTGDDGLGRHNGLLGDKRYSMVGGGYSDWIMNKWLRTEKNWDGMIVSDWGIYGTGASNHGMKTNQGIMTTPQRYLISFLSGMSQSGGTGSVADFTTAYNLGVNGDASIGIPAYGTEYMDNIVNSRAGNVIKTIMKCGLFEDPYTDPDKSDAENGSAALNQLALQAHHDSIIMLKNHDNILPLPMDGSKKVYAIGSKSGSGLGTGYGSIAHDFTGIADMAKRYFGAANMVADPADADVAIVMISGPNNSNGTTNVPQTAQWSHYTKTVGRKVSIGGFWRHSDGSYVKAYEIPNPLLGDYKENLSNIGYTTVNDNNAKEMVRILKILADTKAAMGDKPVVLMLDYRNAVCPAEVEPLADAILAGCWGSQEAYMNLATGVYEPTALAAVTFPRSMELIEMSAEDVPDTTPYVDSDGNVYQFGFGLNYSGRIADERTEKYLGFDEIKEYELGETVTVPIELLPYKYGPAGVTASVHYNKAELKLVSMTAANGFMLVNDGDKFTLTTSNGAGCTAGAVAGYAVFEAANGAKFDASKVTFAMDGPATDGDLNPTMARFADAIVAATSIPGDVNSDGVVDVTDVVMLLQYLAGSRTLTARQLKAADVNADGSVNVGDVTIIMEMTLA